MSSSDDDDDMSSASSESEQIEDEEMEDAVVELNDEEDNFEDKVDVKTEKAKVVESRSADSGKAEIKAEPSGQFVVNQEQWVGGDEPEKEDAKVPIEVGSEQFYVDVDGDSGAKAVKMYWIDAFEDVHKNNDAEYNPGTASSRKMMKVIICGILSQAAEEEDELFNKKFFLKEMWQLRKTPYFEEMDAQGNRWLIRIKKGISDAVLTNDPLPGLTYWAFELDKYLELYRKHFSKEELITFIKIFLPMVRKGELYRDTRVFICITTTLLSKSDMISREDLEIDWRPLYELYYEVRWKKLEEDGLFYLPFKFKTSLIQLIANARQYFSENAVQEILDECRPGLCLWDETFCRVFYVFNNFLPTNLKPEVDAVKGSVLWFDEFWHFFVSLDNNATFHQEIIKIFARMSRQSPGQLDFTGKVDVFFTKLLRSLRLLNLPGHHQRAPMDEICILITYMINTNVHDEVTRNLKQIIGQVESFLYPSNSGKHTLLLLDLLTKLCVCFMDRLRREQTEKRKERKHINPIPESMRLTDAHVQEFVSNLVPLMKLALYSKAKNNLSLLIFKCGALLAPKLVLPLVTDQIYQALETLIEPHRLVQTLTSYLTVLVPLVKDKPDAEGKSQRIHAINVLHSLLPGLDQNDASKCMLTFQVLGVVFNLIPIADSSDAIHLRNDLSEEEKELCSATAGFDSIIAMVMDRMLEMIIDCGSVSANQHSSIYSKSTASMEDNLLHRGTCTVVKAIARNASTALFKIALDKLYAFTCEHIFDSITAVHSLSDMITYAVRSRPDLTFHKFLKLVISRLQSCITPESYEEEKVDFVILWWMIIADKVCRVTGTYLLKHWTDVRTLLDLVIPFKKCTEAVLKCREILESVVANLTSVHLEVCKSRHDLYDKPSDEYLPIRHWAESINKKKWNPTWHVPSKEEFEKADEVLKLYIVPQLDLLRSPQGVDKKLILHALMIIRGMVFSTAHAFQLFEGENIPFVKSACIKQNESEVLIVRPKDLPYLTLDGKHVRQEILDVMLPLIDHLLEHTPDDVKSIQEAISIIRLLPNSRGVSAANVKQTYGRLSSLSMLLRDNLVGNRGNIVMLVEEFLAALHKKREATVQGQCFKQQHLDILKKLLKISISQYSQNRARAQNNLSVMLNEHPGSYKLLINDILYYLKAENSPTHEQQKGALHCLVDNKRSAIAMAKYFSVQNEVWPAIVDMQHSEKESILSLLEENRLNLVENYETYRLTFEWQPETIENALKLLTCAPEGSPLQDSKYLQPLAPEIVEQYKDTSTSLYTEEKRHYYELVNRLTDQANDPKRHWKPVEMAHTMLSMLIRNDIPLPDNVVRMMTRLLVHDTHSTRQRAASLLSSWLQISKPKANKREYVIPNKEPNTGVGAVWPIKYGIRDDNRIMMYEEDKLPQTDEEWDSFQFCGKQHWGLYTWPKELITYAPLKEQTAINRSFEEFTETEKFIVNTFKNKEFLEKLRQLYTVDDRKKDVPFDATNFSLFHGLFRNYGDYLCVDFKEMLEDLIQSVKEKDQSFASEVIAGMISGSKLWYWAKQRRMWTWLGPMLSRNFENLSDDNLRIWGVALATICAGSEARLLKPLIDIIFNLISRPSKNVASAGARLFLAHSSFCQFEWRGLELMHKLWHYIKLGEDENQTYANLREKVALCCVACTWFDLPTVYVSPNLPPQLQPKKIQEVVAWYTENMAACIDEVKARDVRMSAPSGQGISDSASSTSLVSDSEVKKAARAALKGSISYVYTAANQNFTSLSPSFIQLLPIYAHYANDVGDDEMYKTFQDVYSGFLNSVYISPEIVQQVISTLTNSLKSNAWWRTEVVLLQFFSTVVFSNPFVFRPYMEEISQAFIQKLSSRQVEVREKAAECLTRFLGSHFIEPTPELIQGFWESSHSEDAIEKHGGVLGLASIVRACPYNVPKFLPDVLMKLCRFVSHRQPVMDTVKKTFSEFKRTHQDSWREHETQFDEEQLMVLRNILVSPNYYV